MSLGVAASGTVSEISVHEGSQVQSGQTLARLDCRTTEADLRARQARLAAAQAVFDRVRNGPRPDEIAVGEAVVGYSRARAEEAKKTLERTEALQEGVTVSAARVLEVQRDARITAAQLEEAGKRLALLQAGSREEDVRQAQALRDAAAADLDSTRAQLDRCSVHAPTDGVVVAVLANPGQFFSLARPQVLLKMIPNGPARVRAEVEPGDAPRLCVGQKASLAADGYSNAPVIRAEVVSIGSILTRRSVPGADKNETDIVPVVLAIIGNPPVPPIGSAVTVNFDACPPKI
jgi:multidrug resistance efflux pump